MYTYSIVVVFNTIFYVQITQIRKRHSGGNKYILKLNQQTVMKAVEVGPGLPLEHETVFF